MPQPTSANCPQRHWQTLQLAMLIFTTGIMAGKHRSAPAEGTNWTWP
jgi:hypothetical protein